LVTLELRHLHLCAAHDGCDLVKRERPKRQLLLQRCLTLGVLKVCRRLRLVEALCLERRLSLRLLQCRLLVLGKRGVIQPSNVHILTKLLTGSSVVRTRRAHALLEVLRDGTVNGFLCRLSRLEGCHLRVSTKLTRRKPLRELLRLRLVGKLTRLERQLSVLGDCSVLCARGLLTRAKPPPEPLGWQSRPEPVPRLAPADEPPYQG
jgi:hypothetical protein